MTKVSYCTSSSAGFCCPCSASSSKLGGMLLLTLNVTVILWERKTCTRIRQLIIVTSEILPFKSLILTDISYNYYFCTLSSPALFMPLIYLSIIWATDRNIAAACNKARCHRLQPYFSPERFLVSFASVPFISSSHPPDIFGRVLFFLILFSSLISSDRKSLNALSPGQNRQRIMWHDMSS